MQEQDARRTVRDRMPLPVRRALALVLLCLAVWFLTAFSQIHIWILSMLEASRPVVEANPLLGMSLFVLFAAASAMLAFVSSALIVPIGVYAWGKSTCLFLLWLGWILGGICAYTISRFLGRPVVRLLASNLPLESYEHWISHQTPIGYVFLFQLGLPSEIPGYVLGFLRYNFGKYLLIVAVGELPYALATIYLGQGFLERNTILLAGIGLAALGLSAAAMYCLQRWAPRQ